MTDFVVLYIIPVSISGFCYFNIIKTLRGSDKHVERNRNLSICFVLSWTLWVICWAPKFIVTLFQLSDKPVTFSYGKFFNKILFYLYPSAFSFQLLYSQINPLLYIILLKPFQNNVLRVTSTIVNFILKTEKTELETEAKTETGGNNSKTTGLLKPSFIIFSTVVVLCAAIGSSIGLSKYMDSHITDFKTSCQSSFETLSQSNSQFGLFNLHNKDTMLAHHTDKSRESCVLNRGVFNFHFKRCFFLLENPTPGLNLWEQMEKCEQKSAILSYPRTYEEILFMWEFFESRNKDLTLKYLMNATLHVGYVMEQPVIGVPNFESVDHLMTISSNTHHELFQKPILGFIFFPFMGPAICISKAQQLSACMPRTPKIYSICSVDL